MFPKPMHQTEALPADLPDEGGAESVPGLLSGEHNSVIMQNVQELKNRGVNEREAHRLSMAHSKKGHPNRHKNLGKFLHARKDGKDHGSEKNNPAVD